MLLLMGLVAATASAGTRICTTRDVLVFGNGLLGTTAVQSAVVSNCGDAPWTFTDVSVHAATASAYRVATTCATGQTLQPAEACRLDVTFAPVAAGQVSGALWLRNTTSTPDQLVTFYGRGVDAQAGTAVLEFAPPTVAFGPQVAGTLSAPITVALRNTGTASFTPRALVLNGPDAFDFRALGTCALGVPVPAGGACEMSFFFQPSATGNRRAQFNVDAPELANLAILSLAGTAVNAAAPTVEVVEFYNAALNHYFLTAVAEEATAIDGGVVGPDWRRTGYTFRSYSADETRAPAAFSVCRFFGTPGVGPSAHFYTANPDECAAVKQNPYWLYEGIAFQALLPSLGTCGLGTRAVIRFFWPGPVVLESRHRFVTDPAELVRMRGAGWIEEGPVFCSPG